MLILLEFRSEGVEVEEMASQTVQTRRWTVKEYDRMVAAGVFHPEERLELLQGEIIPMTPQGSGHAAGVRLLEEALRKVFTAGFDVRTQMPLALEPDSEPEPDVAVVVGAPRDYRNDHPRRAVLVAEVADGTLPYDRERKALIYAQAGIQEYWILNLVDRCLEIHRDPSPVGSAASGYRSICVAQATETVSPLARPDVSISMSDLLP